MKEPLPLRFRNLKDAGEFLESYIAGKTRPELTISPFVKLPDGTYGKNPEYYAASLEWTAVCPAEVLGVPKTILIRTNLPVGIPQ